MTDQGLDRDARAGVLRVAEALLHDVFERDCTGLNANTRFNDDLGMDSLDVLAFAADLSRRLGVEIEVVELAELASVGQCMDLALARMARQTSG